MIKIPADIKIYLGLEPIHMNKSFDGLAALVQDKLNQNPLSGHLFVFRNRRSDKIKFLFWDRNGFMQVYKRLEKGRFKFPKLTQFSHLVISPQELELLLDGIDFTRLKRLPELQYQAVV